VMDDLFWEHGAWVGRYSDDHADESLAWSVKTKGVKVFKLSAAEKAKFDAPLVPIVDQWVKKMGANGVPAAKIVADVKALIKKHSK